MSDQVGKLLGVLSGSSSSSLSHRSLPRGHCRSLPQPLLCRRQILVATVAAVSLLVDEIRCIRIRRLLLLPTMTQLALDRETIIALIVTVYTRSPSAVHMTLTTHFRRSRRQLQISFVYVTGSKVLSVVNELATIFDCRRRDRILSPSENLLLELLVAIESCVASKLILQISLPGGFPWVIKKAWA